jgi:hypothetical protein
LQIQILNGHPTGSCAFLFKLQKPILHAAPRCWLIKAPYKKNPCEEQNSDRSEDVGLSPETVGDMHDGCDYAGTWLVAWNASTILTAPILAAEETPARQEQEGGGQAEARLLQFRRA